MAPRYANPIMRRKQWHDHSRTPKFVDVSTPSRSTQIRADSIRSLLSFEDDYNVRPITATRWAMSKNFSANHIHDQSQGSNEFNSRHIYDAKHKPHHIDATYVKGLETDYVEDSIKMPREAARYQSSATSSVQPPANLKLSTAKQQPAQNIQQRAPPKKRFSFLSYFFGRNDFSKISPEAISTDNEVQRKKRRHSV